MKKNCLNICLLALLALGGCRSERTEYPAQGGFGYLALDCRTSTEVETRAAAAVKAPAAKDLTLTIRGKDVEYEKSWASSTDFVSAENKLQKGSYTATAAWGDMAQEGLAKPCYAGSVDFHIDPQKVTEATLPVQIANSMVQVVCTEQFKGYFHDAHFTLTSAAGNTFEMTPDEPTLAKDAVSEYAVFIAPGAFSLTGSALKQTGAEFTFPEQSRTAAARTCYTFRYDVSTAGTATVTISLDDTVIDELPVDVELNPEA